jgi:hypothetical protein
LSDSANRYLNQDEFTLVYATNGVTVIPTTNDFVKQFRGTVYTSFGNQRFTIYDRLNTVEN